LVFTEEAANEAFQTIGLGAPEGCKFEGVSTTHSQMKVRWETPPFQVENSDKNIVDFLVVPTPCAGNYEVEPSGSELSLKDIDGSARACPNQWAQLVQLVQNEKLPNPVSVRAP
jgi:hypothetical protein